MPSLRSIAWFTSLLLMPAPSTRSQEGRDAVLPFDPARISRLSLDGLPRSLAIRQGEDRWLGYDLEAARVFKVWRAPAGQSGLAVSAFTTKSVGETLFAETEAEPWRWHRADGTKTPRVRYLGIREDQGRYELSWELRDGDAVVTLHERVATDPGSGRREFRAEGLAEGESLRVPAALEKHWKGESPQLRGRGWHRFEWRE